jgi:16S rRNA (cytosine1402-N4)-methyltransferase
MHKWQHIPILAQTIKDLLITDKEGLYIDGTLGLGGHTKILLGALGPKAKVFGFDKDEKAILMAKENVADERLITFNLSYIEAAGVLKEQKIKGANGILFDLGLSSYQLDDASRGFSFNKQGPLDMRFDIKQTLTAKDIVNTWPADKIEEILSDYGEEKFASKIARAIVLVAREEPIETTWQLAKIIEQVCPRTSKTHPATRTFQALRIAVNNEFGAVKEAPKILEQVLLPGGRAAFLTFHSLEDRIIKNAFKDLCQNQDNWRLVNKKVIEPSWAEIKQNSRARSAKLRVIERIK